MTGYSLAWLVWVIAALVLEGLALLAKDRPDERRTLSANLRWLAHATGWAHVGARIVLTGFLVWLIAHLGLLS